MVYGQHSLGAIRYTGIMARGGENSAAPWIIGGIAAWLGYKYILKPRIVEPAKLMTYTARLRVQMPAIRFKGDNVEVDIYIQNPNSYPVTINAIVGDVYMITNAGTFKLGNITRYGDVVIKPLGETKYTLGMRERFLGFLPYFTAIAAGKVAHQTAAFNGTVTVNKRPWPIKESLRIS